MFILNAFTKLQAGLFSAFAALAAAGEPAAQPAPELEQIVASEPGDASAPELDFTDEADPTESKRWRCYDDDDWKKYGYCLARCDDDDKWDYERVTDKIRVRGNRDFCKRRARKYCNRRGDHLDDWCFGDRKWGDDHDDDDGDHNRD